MHSCLHIAVFVKAVARLLWLCLNVVRSSNLNASICESRMRYIVCTLLPKNKELVAKAAALGADYQECVKTGASSAKLYSF